MKHLAKHIQIPRGLGKVQFAIIIGIALSGLACLINTYDAIAKINEKRQACVETGDLKKILEVRFIVMLVLSIVALIAGIVLGFIFKMRGMTVAFGFATAGFFGIIYSILSKFKDTGNMGVKLTLSWLSLFLFVGLGFFFGAGKMGTEAIEMKP